MNIVIVMAGGTGSRFGAAVPKQFNLICGKPVIDYVLDAVDASKKTDRIVIVMDRQWAAYSRKILTGNYEIAPNGALRPESLFNGLKLINEKYDCDKIVIVDAVAPLLTSALIDDYFDKLDEYDAVITAQKITGGFTDIYDSRLDREKYIITQSPEGFRFGLLWDSFDVEFPYQETAGMLPDGSRRYYNYGFKNNLKLTYDFELAYAEYMLEEAGRLPNAYDEAFFDKNILLTDGLKCRVYDEKDETYQSWLDCVYEAIPGLLSKWGISSFKPNQMPDDHLELEAISRKNGKVIIRFDPQPTLWRSKGVYEEKCCHNSIINPEKVLDFDSSSGALLIKL